MIYKLHPTMIELYKGDSKAITFLLKTFFVEESFSKERAKLAYDLYLIRNCGRSICRKCLEGRDTGKR